MPRLDPDVKFLRLPEVCDRVGVSRRQIYRWVADGRFPPPIKLGPRVIAWPSTAICQWQAVKDLIG